MWITERQFGVAAIFDLHGSVVGTPASELLQMSVRGRMHTGAKVLVLNMAEVMAVDAEGLDTLSAVAGSARQVEVEVRFAGRMADMTARGLAPRPEGGLRMFETVDDALADIRTALERKQHYGLLTNLDWLRRLLDWSWCRVVVRLLLRRRY